MAKQALTSRQATALRWFRMGGTNAYKNLIARHKSTTIKFEINAIKTRHETFIYRAPFGKLTILGIPALVAFAAFAFRSLRWILRNIAMIFDEL